MLAADSNVVRFKENIVAKNTESDTCGEKNVTKVF